LMMKTILRGNSRTSQCLQVWYHLIVI
jgi:hypothetical protein